MPISKDLEKLRELFLLDTTVQARIKGASSPSQFIQLALTEAQSAGLTLTPTELENAIIDYAQTGAYPEPACPPSPAKGPRSIPFPDVAALSPKASRTEILNTAIDVIRVSPVEECVW